MVRVRSSAAAGVRTVSTRITIATSLLLSGIAACAMSACSRGDGVVHNSSRVATFRSPVAHRKGTYKLGAPYVINGVRYVPRHNPYYDEVGLGSWYGGDFHGRQTANGEIFDVGRITGAHPTLPLPSLVRVTNLQNGRSIVVRINDRGPFVSGRIIDLSHGAASRLGYVGRGVSRVRVQYLGPAKL